MSDDLQPDDAPPYEGMTALVVDDDRVARRVHSKMLERLGFQVTTANDGKSALKITAKQSFDLVLSDLSMPGMSGMDFLKEARARGLTTPIIILTATGTVPKAVEAIKLGAFEFLEKPAKAESLAAVVGDALAGREAEADEDEDQQPEQAADELSLKIEVDEPLSPFKDGQIPAKIGRYEVMERIGKGGMGLVFKCRDPLLGRIVAVKVLHLEDEVPEHQEELVNRFKREASAAATLTHPNIVAVHDMGQDEKYGEWFIVMELLQGRGLHVIMDEKGILVEHDVVTMGFHLADALAQAHAAGITHRDIKPSNILVLSDGSVKLVDFGLAAVRGWKVTVGGRVFGSPSYMSPERVRGEPGGPAGDQFALGVVLYEALLGQNPFDGRTLEEKVLRLLEHDPPPITEFIPSASEKLSNTLLRMMAKKEEDRFPSMDDVAETFILVGQELRIDLKRYKSGL